VNVASYMVALF